MEKERWMWVEGLEGKYEISNLGRVKSHYRRIGPCILKGNSDKRGYVSISTGARPRQYLRIHRLVAKAFLDNPNNYKEVNHIDGNKGNNQATNLEWCSRSHNNAHAYALGLKKNVAKHGADCHFAKLSTGDVEHIRSVYKRGNGTALAKQFGVSLSHLMRIVSKDAWTNI